MSNQKRKDIEDIEYENIFIERIERDILKTNMEKFDDIFSYYEFYDKNYYLNTKFKSHYNIELPKYSKMKNLPYELTDLFYLMIHMLNDKNNIFKDNRMNRKNSRSKNISKFMKYNEKVIKGIEKLPEKMRQYIKSQPTYKYNYYILKYIPLLTKRLMVLLDSMVNIEYTEKDISEFLYSMVNHFDAFILKIFESTKIPNKKEKVNYNNKITTYHFDKFLAKIYNNLDTR